MLSHPFLSNAPMCYILMKIYVVWLVLFQPGFGYPAQLVPGLRPSGAPVPNFFVPMAQQGQQGLHPAGIIAGLHAQQGVSLMHPLPHPPPQPQV